MEREKPLSFVFKPVRPQMESMQPMEPMEIGTRKQTILSSTKGLLNLGALPQTVVQVVSEIDSDTVVLLATTFSPTPHTYISSEDNAISPTASGFSFPSAKIAYSV